MHINRGLLSWGVFLIVAGLILLAVRAGWLSASQIAGWWNLWPLVLIGIGVGLVLTRTPFEVIGSVLVAGTFGLMLGAVLAIGIAGFPGACAPTKSAPPRTTSRPVRLRVPPRSTSSSTAVSSRSPALEARRGRSRKR